MNKNIAKFIHDSVQLVKGWDYKPHLADLESSQWLPLHEVRELQRRKLVRLLRHCAVHVPFYRDAFLDLGIKVTDIHDESVLRDLPIVTKKNIENGL